MELKKNGSPHNFLLIINSVEIIIKTLLKCQLLANDLNIMLIAANQKLAVLMIQAALQNHEH